MNLRPLLLLSILMLGSCSSFKEVHYFSDNTPGIPNYYRVKVTGFSFLSSSRYLSGYFDPNAVNQYFNETKQPEKGRLNVTAFNPEIEVDTLRAGNDSLNVRKNFTPIQTENSRERLVLIYSSHSDAVSNQIGLISQNEATIDALGFLLYDRKYEDLQNIEIRHTLNQQKKSLLVGLGEPLLESLDSTESRGKVNSSLLQYVNVLAAELGNLTPFTNLNQAEEWLEKNRVGILNSTK